MAKGSETGASSSSPKLKKSRKKRPHHAISDGRSQEYNPDFTVSRVESQEESSSCSSSQEESSSCSSTPQEVIPSEEIPCTTPSQEISTRSPSEEIPTTPSQEIPARSTSEEIPCTMPSEEISNPTAQDFAELTKLLLSEEEFIGPSTSSYITHKNLYDSQVVEPAVPQLESHEERQDETPTNPTT